MFGEHICRYKTVGKSSCNVRALTYCDLHKILREDLIDVLEMYPEFAETFEHNLEVTYNLRDVSSILFMHIFMRYLLNHNTPRLVGIRLFHNFFGAAPHARGNNSKFV